MDNQEKQEEMMEKVEDETDAKLFGGKLFGAERNEARHEFVGAEVAEKELEKIEKIEITDEDDFKVLTSDKYSSSGLRRGVCLIIENDMFHTNLGLSKEC